MLNKLLLFFITLIMMSCAHQQARQATLPGTKEGTYDSRFPQTPTAEYLKQISETIKLVSSLTFYKKYHFPKTAHVQIPFLKMPSFLKRAQSTSIVQSPSSGTATVIYAEDNRMALLTCAHVVSSPDTLITFYKDLNSKNTKFIQSVAFKIRQALNVIAMPRGNEITILAKDDQSDLALLGKEVNPITGIPPAVFNYPLGDASKLGWGSFVYLLGFPQGKKIVSSAIVSHPNRNSRHDFIINSNMYRGISGGIILAIRGGVPNFELVGLANALPVQTDLVLRPDPALNPEGFLQQEPYHGKIFVDQQISIIHGLTLAISAETIRKFIRTNLIKLKDQGFNLRGFIKKTRP